jgi:DNA-binding transcriptional MerR regulator
LFYGEKETLMKRTYRIAEFARLAGVTVRTLQYYDRIGLLKPSGSTEAGYRLYHPADLMQLQQILTLKWMGFTLREIKTMLASASYDVRQALALQKAAVEAQIARLQDAYKALTRVIEAAERQDADELDVEMVVAIIRGVIAGQGAEWMRRYYDDGAWTAIQTRRLTVSPGQLQEVQQAWQALFEAFEARRHEPPDSPEVQQLAARMRTLIEAFTGGDLDVEAGLARFVADAETGRLPPDYDGYTPYGETDADLRRFVQRALTIYRERDGK